MEIKRALVSVSDKTGIEEFCRKLTDQGVQLISTGGTHAKLSKAGILVEEISSVTGFPEMMDGRVKTLHPKVHGGILGRRSMDDEVMKEHDIHAIDLVVVNLYPFAQTISREDCTEELAIENIDIGGPAMIRSAAKNFNDVMVVVDPADYQEVIRALDGGETELEMRKKLAIKAFRHTAQYDATVAGYLGREDQFPDSLTLAYEKLDELRYGENPHQSAAFYRQANVFQSGVIASRLFKHLYTFQRRVRIGDIIIR